MLLELEIENFALIDSLRLEFAAGLNVLTGETGAGKSIILDALGFLLGGSHRDPGGESRSARVAGRFHTSPEAIKLLTEWGFEGEPEVLVAREVSVQGRSSARINSRMVTLANLRELGGCLLEIHGQHQSTGLQRPSRHLELLDRFAGAEHLETLATYQAHYQAYKRLSNEQQELEQAERTRVREIEWLEHQVQEIEEVDPQPGEDARLGEEIRRLAAAEELRRGSSQALESLGGEAGARDAVSQAIRSLRPLERHDARVGELLGRLDELDILLGEVDRELASYRDQAEGDPARLQEFQTRQERLKALQRKYGASLEEVLEHASTSRRQLARLRSAGERGQALAQELERAAAECARLAERITETRTATAAIVSEAVHGELEELALSVMRFSVCLESDTELGPSGRERCEFYLAPNPGSPPRPLARVASGGELSRIMLALISLFSRFEPVPSLIFDEIDAGLGGRAAQAVARKLRILAERHQILCVTHLAVIAASGTRHMRVIKHTDGTSTSVELTVLDGDLREQEIARMLSGDATPETAHKHARELLGMSTK